MPEANTSIMHKLISASYSEEEAERFHTYKASNVDKETIANSGIHILRNLRQLRYACAPMSAVWGAIIRDTTSIPVHLVAGNLLINNKKIFYNSGSTESISQEFKKSNAAWDGHVWVNFAGIIGDISIFRTAYAEPETHWLHQLIVCEFGKGRGLLLGAPDNMKYEAKYVLNNEEMTSLVKGLELIT